MATLWLKVEFATPEKPEVLRLAEQLGIDPDDVFGKCFKVWRWFSQNTLDGHARGVTPTTLDRVAGRDGFAKAMASVGWLVLTPGEAIIPRFALHCGQTANAKALAAQRQAKKREQELRRSHAGGVTEPSLDVDEDGNEDGDGQGDSFDPGCASFKEEGNALTQLPQLLT